MNLDRQESFENNSQKDQHSSRKQQESKIVSINDSAKEKSLITKLRNILSTASKPPISRMEVFFETLFNHRKHIAIDTTRFKEWQIQLSNLILEGQQSFDFVNTISPMELSETLLVGYYGMFQRCKYTNRDQFFEIWLKTNRQMLLSS